VPGADHEVVQFVEGLAEAKFSPKREKNNGSFNGN
jgi:hypothetical protein